MPVTLDERGSNLAPDGASEKSMRWLLVAIGALVGVICLLTGIVWIFQGIGVLPGSFMTGQLFWAFAGIVAVIVGVFVLRTTYRFARRK